MEMSQIRYALTAARTLNFTWAAEQCHVSQPALTKAVRALEDELGAKLFHREGRRMLLSEFGRSMLPHLQQIVDSAEATRTLAQNFRLSIRVPVRLGVMSTIGHLRLARFLAQFGRSNPGVEVAVSEHDLDELKSRLQDGQLDLAVLNPLSDENGLRLQQLYTERYVVIIPPDHRLGELTAAKLSDLSGEPYVDRLACEMREMVTARCAEMRVELYARFRSDREDWVQAMVLAGMGFAFMPEYAVSLPGLLQRPLVEPRVERQIVLASMPGRPFSPAAATLVHAARSFAWPG